MSVFAHNLKLALAEYAIKAKEGEPTVLREALAQLFKQYPGLKILIGDAAFAGRELNEAIISLGRDYIAQIKEIPAAVEVKKSPEKNDGSCGLTEVLERC